MKEFSWITKPLPRVDAEAKVTGRARYADDIVLPGMLFCKLLRSHIPHARIRRIDTTRARNLPGVFAVITGKDLPTKYGILPPSQDQEALCVEKVRYVGDPVAAVAAIDEWTAEQALGAIEVEYDPLPFYMTIEDALYKEGEPIHAQGNVHKEVSLEFGDVEAGFREAEYIREDTFLYQGSAHLPLEEHAALASYEQGGMLTVWSSTQVPHYLHRILSKVLGLPMSRIRVIATPVGGGFGGKSDIFPHEIVVAKLAMVTGRPVKCTLTREEVFYSLRRHPYLMWVRTGVRADGTITAMHFRAILEGGAYGSYGVATTYYAGALQPITYRIPAYRFEGMRVFTNAPPGGPKRGHGTPQPRFALECHLDKIAEDLGMDPVELRKRNLVEPHTMTVNWLRITSCGLAQCLERVVEASGFSRKHRRLPRGRGVGLAVSGYLSGAGLPIYWNDLPHSQVHLQVDRSGSVTLSCGAIDIGQGSNSVLVYTVCEVLGISPEDVRLVVADTAITPVDLGSYSSRVTFMAGNAALQAAQRMRDLIAGAVAEKLGVPRESLLFHGRQVQVAGDARQALSWREACEVAEARYGMLSATGAYTPPRLAGPYKGSGVGPSPAYSYSACVAEVSVDEETGVVSVEKVWIAHDIGRALNPLLVLGQVEGSVYMGLGEALMEDQSMRWGVVRGPSMLEYKSPTVREMPEVEVFLIETVDPEGPFGAKECGQGPLLPVAPAIANAVYDAVGVRIDEVPITPEKVLKALEQRAKGQEPRVGPRGFPAVKFKEPLRVTPPHPATSPARGEGE